MEIVKKTLLKDVNIPEIEFIIGNYLQKPKEEWKVTYDKVVKEIQLMKYRGFRPERCHKCKKIILRFFY